MAMTTCFLTVLRAKLLGLVTLVCLAIPSASSASVDALRCPTEATRLVVLGDSLADGLWGALYRGFARCPGMDIIRLTKVSDGLAKSSADVWLDRYAKAAEAREVKDIVIVQIGANDITFVRDGSKRAVFGTPEWTAAYTARAKELATGLSSRANTVLWFGLPVVGSARLEPSYREISTALQNTLVETEAAFVDIHTLTKFGTGSFTMSAKVDGRVQQMRATDRVHFTPAGYDEVLSAVTDELEAALALQERSVTINQIQLQ